MVARVSVPFTGGHYYGREERPNTELADNSLSARRKSPLTIRNPIIGRNNVNSKLANLRFIFY